MTKSNPGKSWPFGFRLATLLTLLLVVAFILLSLIPIDLSERSPAIKAAVEERIRGTVEMERILFNPLPYPRIRLENFTLSDDKEVIVEAQAVRADIALFPLLFKKITIKKLHITDGALRLRRDNEGRINIQQLRKKKIYRVRINSFKLKQSSLVFIDDSADKSARYEMEKTDAFLYSSADGLSFAGEGLILPDTTFHVSGKAQKDDGLWNISGKLSFENLMLGRLAPYLKKEDMRGTEVLGSVSLDSVYSYTGLDPFGATGFKTGSLKGQGLIKGSATSKDITVDIPGLFTKPIGSESASTDIELSWNEDKIILALDETMLAVDDYGVEGSFALKLAQKSEDWGVELKITTTPVEAAYLKELIDTKAVPKSISSVVDRSRPVAGSIALRDLSFSTGRGLIKTLSLEAQLDDYGFSHPRLENRFSSINGKISFKDEVLFVEGIRGLYGSSAVEDLFAEVKNVGGEFSYSASANASLNVAEALDEIGGRLGLKAFHRISASGRSILKLSVEGGGKDLKDTILVRTSLDMTDTEVRYKEHLKKPNGHRIGLDAVARIKTAGKVVAEGNLLIGNSTLKVKAMVGSGTGKGKGGPTPFRVELNSEDIALEDIVKLSPYFDTPIATGSASLELTVKRKSNSPLILYDGELRVDKGVFKGTFLQRTVRRFDAVARLNGNSGKVVLKRLEMGDSDLSGRLTISDISKGLIDFNFISEHLHLSDFLPSADEEAIPKPSPGSESIYYKEPFVTGRGVLSIKNGTIWKSSFETFRAEVRIGKKEMRFEPVSFIAHNGEVSGNATYFRERTSPLLFKTALSADRVELAPLIRDIGAKEDILTGRLTARLNLKAKRGFLPLSSGMDGDARLMATDGSLYRFVVLSKIFSIINIVSITDLFQSGLPYSGISGDYTIKDGVIKTENMVFKSKTLRMGAIGKITMPTKRMKATLSLHPFVTVDKIVSTIPIAGWILIGKQGIISMYYRIKGPLTALKVEPMTAKGMGKNILGIFGRLLTAPIKALEPLIPEKGPNEPNETNETGETGAPALLE